jgi:ABC-type antimicrobial peptide transport system permease subunit
MIRNFFLLSYRNLQKHKGFALINISGLSIGMATALLILLWVANEWSYDRFYPNADRLYQCWNRDKGNKGIDCWNITPKSLAGGLKLDYPEIEKATRVGWDETLLFSIGDKKMNIKGSMVDPDFLTMFGLPFEQGDPNIALNHPGDIVITEKLARKLFGEEDPKGKSILIDNRYPYQVSGVMKDLPNNTQFDFEFLLPWSYMHDTGQDDSSWENNSTKNYVLLKPHVKLADLNYKIRNIIKDHCGKGTTVESFLYPMSRLRLFGNFENGVPAGGRIERVRVFLIIAVFILLIACINFMNLSTASSEKRAKEVGIRKVAGAHRGALVGQFLGESVFMACLSGGIALFIVKLSLPYFNELTNKQLYIDFQSPLFWILFAGFLLLTGILAGSYPAFYLSSFRPVLVLKSGVNKPGALITPRRVLVVLQFTISIALVICTLIIRNQVDYAQEREAGYKKDHVIYTFLSGDISKNYQLIKDELMGQGIAIAISKCSAPLTEGWSSGGADWHGKNPNDRTEFNFFMSDGNLVQTASLQLVEGRDIDLKNYPTDSNAVLLNETAAKTMGFRNPIGQIIDYGAWGTDWHVIGVIKDFILQSPYDPIKPMVIQGPKANWFNLIHIRLNGTMPTAKALQAAEAVFKKYNPLFPFEYHFIDKEYAKKFEDEETTGKLTAFFAGLTIFISCIGLFGLATYLAQSRIKEIGIRKVLGASALGIVVLLSSDFLKQVAIAILVASPLAWWAMGEWLSQYAYHVPIGWWIFVSAGSVAIMIALLTVSFQALKAAMANPVKSLRSE